MHIWVPSFLDPEDVANLNMGAMWNFGKGTGLHYTSIRVWGTKVLFLGLGASGPQRLEPRYYSILSHNGVDVKCAGK